MQSNLYSVTEARENLGVLLDQLEEGKAKEILITRRGVCVAKLVPQKKKETDVTNRIGFAKGKLYVDDKVFNELDEEISGMMIGGEL